MEHRKLASEFETVVDRDGKIIIPKNLLSGFARRKVHVRISKQEIAAELTANGVTDDEIERISSLQLEVREQVIKFLLTEGVLKGSAFMRRARGMHR